MKKRLISSLLLIGFSFATLVSCSGKGSSNVALSVDFEDSMPIAYVGEEYDFSGNIIMEEGVSYSLQAYYQDYYEHTESELPVVDLCFTPVKLFDISVVVTATKGNEIAKNTTTLTVKQKGDTIDELLMSGGWSGWADSGFRKELTDDPKYLKDENSKSALSIMYQGNNAFTWGGSLLCMQNFRCLDAWADKTWENAIITAWVYNPTDYDLEFQLRIKDVYLQKQGGVDIDWGQPGQIPQTAPSKEWTQIFFSLKKYGITHTLFENEEGTRKDSLIIKTKWAGAPKDEFTPPYSFNFYMDGVDIVPHTMYPQVDTKVPSAIEDIIMKSWYDPGVSLTDVYTAPYVAEGEASLKMHFDSDNIKPGDGVNNKAYPSGMAVMSMNNSRLPSLWKDQTWDNAIFTFVAYNDSEEDVELALRIKDYEKVDIDWGHTFNPIQTLKTKTWTRFFFSMNKIGINRPLKMDGSLFKDEFILKARYTAASSTERYTYTVYFDSIDVVPNTDYPEVDTRSFVSCEEISDGLENLPIDTGYSRAKYFYDKEKTYTEEYPSKCSMALSFKDTTDFANPSISFSPEEAVGKTIPSLPSLASGTLSADLYFEGVTDTDVELKVWQNGWTTEVTKTYSVTPLKDSWVRLEVDLGADQSFKAIDQCIRICLRFKGVDDNNRSSAAVYIDNLFLIQD